MSPSTHDASRSTDPLPESGFWAERLCDAGLAFFALWTLSSHAVVFAGGSLRTLLAVFVAVVFAYGGLRRILRRRLRPRDAAPATPTPNPWALPPRLRWLLLGVGFVPALLFSDADRFVVLWLAVAAVLAAGLAICWTRPSPAADGAPPEPAAVSPLESRGLFALGLAAAALALVAHAANLDDAFYVSLSVQAVEEPGAPLLDGDPMHGVDGLPLYIPIYRVHSLETLVAAVAYLTGVPPLPIFHLLLAPLGAFLVPIAHAVLLRRLLPRHWLAATAVLVAVLAAPVETVRWYGALALFRSWQGKSLFLAVATPLLYAAALRFAAHPTRRRWLGLAAAQVAAVGLTSTAFFAAPVAAGLGLVAGLKHSPSSLRTLLLGVLGSGYLVGLGLALKGSVVASVNPPPELSPQERIHEVFTLIVSADNPLLWTVVFAAVAASWVAAPAGLARRFALVVPLGAWMVFINPYLGGWVMAHVTHRQHWRSMWTLPVPLLVTLLLLAPLLWHRRPETLRLRVGLSLGLTALFLAFVPATYGPSRAAGVEIKAPGLKVTPAFDGARAITRAFEPGDLVAATPEVNAWLPTFIDRVRPLSVRFYLRRMGPLLGEDELRRRDFLPRLLVGDTDWAGAPNALRSELDAAPDIVGVALPASRQRDAYREVLGASGFERLPSAEAAALDLDLWRRAVSADDAASTDASQSAGSS
ncbi:MAG: DUF6077 domain-containing protein [Acidobacteriota bacterium]